MTRSGALYPFSEEAEVARIDGLVTQLLRAQTRSYAGEGEDGEQGIFDAEATRRFRVAAESEGPDELVARVSTALDRAYAAWRRG
jgi:hypothetical protein